MDVLHLIASPRGAQSRTLTIADSLLEYLSQRCPEVTLQTRNLFDRDLPAVDGVNMDSKYRLLAGIPLDPQHTESWSHIEHLISEFLAADLYVLSVPMWNFSIPYPLKHYIDAIVQPRYLFAYDATGAPVPLVHGKRMICVTSRGGDYSPAGPMHAYDAQESYLRQIFGFVGVTDIEFVHAQPMDLGPEVRARSIEKATTEVRAVVDRMFSGAGTHAAE
jgi:FMN-dependent NADH-azoreductase